MTDQVYAAIKRCRACRSERLTELLRLRDVPAAGIYAEENERLDIRLPLTLAHCSSCGLVQLRETIGPEIYRHYSFAGGTSASYQAYLDRLAKQIVVEYELREKRVYEVGAGDGTFLKCLAEHGDNEAAGIEPSQKLCAAAAEKGVQVRQGYFNAASVADARPEPYDCVVVRHVLEHIDDLHDMITSLRFILKEDGVLLVEVPSLEKTVENRSYSNLFHEHLNYFSVPVLSRLFGRYGFTVDRGRFVDIHGGSILMLFRLGHASAEPIATTGGPVAAAAAADPEPVRAFAADAPRYFARVRERIASLASGGKVVHGYGASHRTFALLGGAGLDERQVPVIYDVNPFLRRKRLNGIGSLVLSADGLQQASDHPDAIVILALSYQAELVRLLRDQYGYAGDIVTLGAEVNLP